jgi:hypothetical protein
MERMKKSDIKEITETNGMITVKYEKESQLEVSHLKMRWAILKEQEERLQEEKEKLEEIARQANIILK